MLIVPSYIDMLKASNPRGGKSNGRAQRLRRRNLKSKTSVILDFARLSRGGRRAAALLAILMVALTVPASADTIGISGGVLIVGTEPGDGNQVYAPTIVGPDLVLPNLHADIVTPGCTDAGGSINCPLAGFQELVILGGDGDDVIQLSGISGLTFPITALGGPGNDVLIGTPGNVKLFGGPGDDVLVSMPGNCFSRGTGADIVLGAGCDAGPEPVISPLPRQIAETPEPDGFVLLGTVLVGLTVAGRMSFMRGFRRLNT
jgi:RTX calcium-binding nonapeptide repeat (4 copies)